MRSEEKKKAGKPRKLGTVTVSNRVPQVLTSDAPQTWSMSWIRRSKEQRRGYGVQSVETSSTDRDPPLNL